MTMNCQDTERLVEAYLDRELPQTDRQRLLTHLETCPQCRAQFAPLLDLLQDLQHAAPPLPPAELYDRVLANLPPISRPSHLPRRLLWPAAIATAAAASLAFVLWPLGRTNFLGPAPVHPQETPVAPAPPFYPLAMISIMAGQSTASPAPSAILMALAGIQLSDLAENHAGPAPTEIALCMSPPMDVGPNASQTPPQALRLPMLELFAGRAAVPGRL